MAATGWRVIDKRGGSFDFKSGEPEKDKEGAEQLKEQLGDDATMTPLGGAEAYVSPSQPTFDGRGGVIIFTPKERADIGRKLVLFFEKIAEIRRAEDRFTCPSE